MQDLKKMQEQDSDKNKKENNVPMPLFWKTHFRGVRGFIATHTQPHWTTDLQDSCRQGTNLTDFLIA